MEYVGHKRIKEFHIDGMIDMMRSNGYVPHLDVDPAFSLEYKGENYTFLLTIYGVYVGKAKAQCYLAVSGNNLIPMNFIQKDR